MKANIWVMWNDENDFADWKNGDVTSECETVATVSNDTYRIEYEYCDGKITVIEMELTDDKAGYETVDEYISSDIIVCNDTLSDVMVWLLNAITGL